MYYPDKTRVGWWKNGYPEYFAKVLNAAFWIGVDIEVDGEPLDLATVAVTDFYREMDMRRSVLTRRMTVTMRNGVEVSVEAVPLSVADAPRTGRHPLCRHAAEPRPPKSPFRRISTPMCAMPTPTTTRNSGNRSQPTPTSRRPHPQERFRGRMAQAVELEGAEFGCGTQLEQGPPYRRGALRGGPYRDII